MKKYGSEMVGRMLDFRRALRLGSRGRGCKRVDLIRDGRSGRERVHGRSCRRGRSRRRLTERVASLLCRRGRRFSEGSVAGLRRRRTAFPERIVRGRTAVSERIVGRGGCCRGRWRGRRRRRGSVTERIRFERPAGRLNLFGNGLLLNRCRAFSKRVGESVRCARTLSVESGRRSRRDLRAGRFSARKRILHHGTR